MPKSLADRIDQDPAPGWRPNAGDKIVGTIVEISEGRGDYEPYPIVTVEQTDGTEVAIHCFHTVLKKEIAAKGPNVGDGIAVKYLGKPAGKDYESYRVIIERRTSTAPATDWKAHEETADLQLAGTPAASPADWANEEPF